MGNVSAAAERPAPQRGRPARISREAILEAAATVLEQNPTAPLSLSAIARVLKITPMAIYTYFASKDELQQALTERLLSGFDLDVPAGADALTVIRLWANAMRRHFLQRPRLIDMLVWEGGHASVGWLKRSVVISDALESLGLKDRDLARATIWIWQGVMAAIHAELTVRLEEPRFTAAELAAIDSDLQQKLAGLADLAAEPDYADNFFDYQVDRLIDGVRALTGLR